MLLHVALLIANISGTIVDSNQTHLIINSGNDLSPTNIVTMLGIFVAIGFSGYSIWKGIRDAKESQDSHKESINTQNTLINTQETLSKYQRLIAVYDLVNNVEEREARKNIYRAYRLYYSFIDMENGKDDWNSERLVYTSTDGKEYDDIFRDRLIVKKYKNIDKDVEKVRATLDHIGSLFIHNLIPKETLLSTFWGAGLRCWECLESNIMIERDRRGTIYYMNNFEDFVKEIRQYMDDNNLSLKFY